MIDWQPPAGLRRLMAVRFPDDRNPVRLLAGLAFKNCSHQVSLMVRLTLGALALGCTGTGPWDFKSPDNPGGCKDSPPGPE